MVFVLGLEGHLVTQPCRGKCKALLELWFCVFFLVELNGLATPEHVLRGLLLFPQVVFKKKKLEEIFISQKQTGFT